MLQLATPIKAWAQRFALLSLLSIAVALMLMAKADIAVIDKAQMAVTDAVAPILDAASRPVASAVDVMEQLQELNAIRTENAALRADNQRLLHWQLVARRLETENNSLREALRLVPDPAEIFVTARVIGDHGGAFVRSVLVNAGRRDGIGVGQAALANTGLAGRVAQVGGRSARVLLVTDMNSRIPVMVGAGRSRAVLAGDNSKQPSLVYLGPRVRVETGDRVLTSGHGGVFPPGLPVGVVAAVEEGIVRVQPYTDGKRLEYLRLVDYELPGILLSPDEPH
jgi:rod shape-determining protein MreC